MVKFGLLLLASYMCYTSALQPCVCGRNFAPVCGSDGVTYSNQCRLDCERSTGNNDLRFVKEGNCEGTPAAERPCICTMEYRPVCGTDGRTYPNACALGCEKAKTPKLEKKSDDVCPDSNENENESSVPPVCKTCTRNMRPVCGTDGVSYNNECLLNCAAAKQSKDIKVALQGRCEEVKVNEQEFDEDNCECTREMIPVCGKNGVTFSNRCMLKCAGVEEARVGKC